MTKEISRDIDDYISRFPENAQRYLQQMRQTIHTVAPDAQEAISYGIPTFTFNGYLVHFAAYKRHIGFYPGAAAITAFQQELSGYKSAKGSVQFPLDQQLPLTLVRRIVEFRMQQKLRGGK